MTEVAHIKGPESTDKPEMTFSPFIGGKNMIFGLKWNDRVSAWTLSISTADNETIIAGIRVVGDYDMLQPFTDIRLPSGQLIANDTQNKGADPGRDDWRGRHILLYGEFETEFDDGLTTDPRFEDVGPV